MPDLPDAASAGAPGEDLIERMANAMFRGLPSGSPTPLGGFGAALPSTPLPDAFAPTVTTSGPIPVGTTPIDRTTSTLGAGIPPVLAPPPSGTPSFNTPPSGTSGTSLGGFGAPLPSTPLPGAVSPSAIPGEIAAATTVSPSESSKAAHTSLPAPTSSAIPPHGSVTPDGIAGGPAARQPVGLDVPLFSDPNLVAPQQAVPNGGLPLAGNFGASRPSPLPDVPALGLAIPGADELRALLAAATIPFSLPTADNDATPYYYFLTQPDIGAAPSADAFDVNLLRHDFPILSERVNGRPLIWFDNAATTQKPRAVIDRLSSFYEHENSNIHRAAHELAARATDAYEKARDTVRRFINAGSADDIVFVRGTTEAINLIANTWGRRFISKGDEIVITWLEHHANIVPWQLLCEQTGALLKVAPVDERGQVKLDEYGKLLGARTKLVSFASVSNALGTVTPARIMTEMAHTAGARVLLDGAQSVSHMRSDVQALDVDWFVFSGHKVFGPTGIGAVYGKPEVLAESPPWQGGGNMIDDVTFEHTAYKAPPSRFEAGTGNIADAVGLAAALEYVERVGIEAIGRHEHDLLTLATHLLYDIPGLRIIGTAAEKAAVVSFVLDGIDPVEVGTALNEEGIAVRAGHHCAQPILRRFGLESTVRLSLALYNTQPEVDAFAAAVRRIQSKRAPLNRTLANRAPN
jgi:cysteine desulfurase / selenocysteine lyase